MNHVAAVSHQESRERSPFWSLSQVLSWSDSFSGNKVEGIGGLDFLAAPSCGLEAFGVPYRGCIGGDQMVDEGREAGERNGDLKLGTELVLGRWVWESWAIFPATLFL